MSINFKNTCKGGFMAAGGKERQLTKTSERNYSKLISVFLWGLQRSIYSVPGERLVKRMG